MSVMHGRISLNYLSITQVYITRKLFDEDFVVGNYGETSESVAGHTIVLNSLDIMSAMLKTPIFFSEK